MLGNNLPSRGAATHLTAWHFVRELVGLESFEFCRFHNPCPRRLIFEKRRLLEARQGPAWVRGVTKLE